MHGRESSVAQSHSVTQILVLELLQKVGQILAHQAKVVHGAGHAKVHVAKCDRSVHAVAVLGRLKVFEIDAPGPRNETVEGVEMGGRGGEGGREGEWMGWCGRGGEGRGYVSM